MPETPSDIRKAEARTSAPMMNADCRRFLLSGEHGTYQIFLYQPNSSPPPGGFPVLYLLDANMDFALVVEIVRRMSLRPEATGISPLVIVGIGYPDDENSMQDRRYVDFVRGPGREPPPVMPPGMTLGRQAEFVHFLEKVLVPHVSKSCAVAGKKRILLGHSLAGYFALDLFCRRNALFSAYIAVSPSLWWDFEALLADLGASTGAGSWPSLYTAVGRWEEQLAPWQDPAKLVVGYEELRHRRRMVGNMETFATEVARVVRGKGRFCCEVREDQDHASLLVATLSRALRFVG